MRAAAVRHGGAAVHVAGSQIALAASNYLVLAIAARQLTPAAFTAVSAYYLLINTVGRGLFSAVELETTRAVAAGAEGRRAALVHTGVLLVGALALLGLSAPLLAAVLPGAAALGLLAVGAVTMAASYLIRGPLAGGRSYGRYATTFWIEAGVGLGAAVVLALLDERAATSWIAVLALAPLAAPLLLHGGAFTGGPVGALRPVLWSAALVLASQGVWNLAPVLVTARLTDAPAVAAGFTTAAVIVRAPVLLFPAIQALLLPRLAARPEEPVRLPRALAAALGAAGLAWVALAMIAVPWLAALVFATTTPPPPWVLAALALSTVLGTVAQLAQARLVAARRVRVVALVWLAGLAVLLCVGFVARPPVDAAALGQLAAALIVVGVLVIPRSVR